MKLLQRASAAVCAALLLCTPASATWSVVFVDNRTGEIAVGSATCLSSFDLLENLAVIWVGAGGGAAQSQIDVQGTNRRIMRDGLRDGQTPQEIMDELVFGSGTQPGKRQYGIAAFSGPAATWSGGQVAQAKPSVTGQIGALTYAIQGNILVGDEVVAAAERALRESTGDSGERLLAAMIAAARFGGDGRCSCDQPDPTACGAPPPSFTKSAHVGFMVVARMGDTNGNCNSSAGCANGSYYLNLNVIGTPLDPDPVLQLRDLHADWRAGLAGRPDHLLSRVQTSADRLPADGESSMTVRVRLVDLNGEALAQGGAIVSVSASDPLAPLVDVSPVRDLGDGSYAFRLRAGTETGVEELVITADDGSVKATLHPPLRVSLIAPAALSAGFETVSLGAGQPVPFVLHEERAPGASYLLLGSASGTLPGIDVGNLRLPLNPDAWMAHALSGAVDLTGAWGTLDAHGRAQAIWLPDASLLGFLSGRELSWAALTFDGTLRVTNVVTLDTEL